MIQFELAMVYFATFCIKVRGAPWLQGTAMYYIYHLDEFRRFPVPAWLLGPTMLKLEGWAALVLEFSLGVLIWVKELRYILLALGVLFHLTLEYSLNIPMFQWDILSAYILFVDPADARRAWNWIRQHLPSKNYNRELHPSDLQPSSLIAKHIEREPIFVTCLGLADFSLGLLELSLA